MKPDWKNAPEWANWVAMDNDGIWFWYEDEPVISDSNPGEWESEGKYYIALQAIYTWEDTKQKRN